MNLEKQKINPKYGVPLYVESNENYKKFLKINNAKMNEGSGYMFVRLDRDNFDK